MIGSWAMSRRMDCRPWSWPCRSTAAAKWASIGRHQLRLVLAEDRARVRVEEDEPEEVVARHGRRMRAHAAEK